MKRIFDALTSIFILLIFCPIFLLGFLFVGSSDKGPVFYRAIRIGKNNKKFIMYKFRTMVVDAEKIGGSSTADDDSRITRVGKFLRKYKLDELPQLINVLKGEMSIVGPRPEVKHYVDMYTEEEKAILSVKPGITDYASIWNPDEGAILAGSEDPEKTYLEKIRPKKIQLQLKYVREQSFRTDMKIIFLTARNLFLKKVPIAEEEM